ncbi:Methyl-CpG-binding domain protein 3 [Merluccius polli]|uniref:Methyl-CpG-binding domain protein 3 n=1 Tax=Merluccius polli TaxID=89951 RepID=A0AA47NUA6_MERPO|nr:Methyl-CpG-binding domain protein 3 [Merluccius polli]
MERKGVPTKRFLNKPHIARCLGSSSSIAGGVHAIDPATGRMLTAKLQHNRHKHPPHSSHIKAKPDLNTTLPVRQTASIFKQPVTKVTNHPTNKVKTDPHKALEQPKQLFWEKKLSGLNAFDIAEELVKSMDLPKGLQGVGPVCSDRSLLSAITSALHTSPKPVTGQHTSAVEKNPGVWLNTTQPLCKAFMVTDEDISQTEGKNTFIMFSTVICRKQEDMVHNVRRRLEKALMADMLAHLEDKTADAKTFTTSTTMEVDQ